MTYLTNTILNSVDRIQDSTSYDLMSSTCEVDNELDFLNL